MLQGQLLKPLISISVATVLQQPYTHLHSSSRQKQQHRHDCTTESFN